MGLTQKTATPAYVVEIDYLCAQTMSAPPQLQQQLQQPLLQPLLLLQQLQQLLLAQAVAHPVWFLPLTAILVCAVLLASLYAPQTCVQPQLLHLPRAPAAQQLQALTLEVSVFSPSPSQVSPTNHVLIGFMVDSHKAPHGAAPKLTLRESTSMVKVTMASGVLTATCRRI